MLRNLPAVLLANLTAIFVISCGILETPIFNSPLPPYSIPETQTLEVSTLTPLPTTSIIPTPTIQLFSRSDGWIEFRNTLIGYTVAFPPKSYFEYSEYKHQICGIDSVLIWFTEENVSPGLGVHIITTTNSDHLSAEEYFRSSEYPSQHPIDDTINNATEVNFQGIIGTKFVTMAIADQYIILVPYNSYIVKLTVLYGSPVGPNEMTPEDNQFMDTFLHQFVFNP